MILKHIYLMPDLIEFPSKANSDFRFETRHICNYVERRLAAEKVVAGDFNRIVVVGQSVPKEMYVNSSNVLSVPVKIDIDEWRALDESCRSDYYTGLLMTGFARCATRYPIPLKALTNWLDDLKRMGYRNGWLFKKRSFAKLRIECALECRLTIRNFTLILRVSERNGPELFAQEILKTLPDELIFHQQFKDIVIENNEIVVPKRIAEPPLFRMPVPSIH